MVEFTLEGICIIVVLKFALSAWLVLKSDKLNYGRFTHSFTSIQINPKFGWFLFEVPNLVWAYYFIFLQGAPLSISYALFIIHYINRDIVYPLSLKTTTPIPLRTMVSAFIFTSANGYLQGLANEEGSTTSIFIQYIGVILFFGGMAINVYSDRILQEIKQKLNKENDKKYVRIDKFLFKYVANPNYLGQVIEWIGYALASGHIYAFMFAFSTISILTPGAIARSRWNKKNIPDYPQDRKAIFPMIV